MSTFDIESLLSEVSPEAPCGEDISGSGEFYELKALVRPKPPGVVGTDADAGMIEPNWAEVRNRAFDLLRKSRHLEVATYLTLGLLVTEGMSGFRNGLHLIQGLLERFWDELYPRLDPEDDNDPTIRMNILMPLSSEPASPWDPVRFRPRVAQLPLCNSRRAGGFCLRDIQIARGEKTAPSGEREAPAMPVIQATFRETPAAELEATLLGAHQAVEYLDGIRSVFEKRTKDHSSPEFGGLRGDLVRICRTLEEYVKTDSAANPATPGDATVGPAAGREPIPVVAGEIRSRNDALAAIEQACRYFERHEPSSPVPLLLRRAQRLAPKTFLEIIEDVCPGGMAQVVAVGGSESGSEGAGKT